MEEPWYVSAFGIHYNDLYHHRDNEDARRAIEFLLRDPALASPAGPVLDLCCGSGRHCLEWLEGNGGNPPIVGLDLAPNLLRDAARAARAEGRTLALLRADMRRLPFLEGSFHLVFNLFTSFGYFLEEAENEAVFSEVARILDRPGGHFVFDHINPDWLKTHLVTESERVTPGGIAVRESRSVDSARSRVEKRVEFRSRGKHHEIHESVRFYERAEVEAMAARVGLSLQASFGDFDNSPLSSQSPRAIYVFRTKA